MTRKLFGALVLLSSLTNLAISDEIHMDGKPATQERKLNAEITDGVVFECAPENLQAIKKRMLQLLTEEFKWPEKVFEVNEQDGKLQFRMREKSTDTRNLKANKDLNIKDESWEYTNGFGQDKKRYFASKKEIIAALLTRGRKTEFKADECTFDHFYDNVLMRQEVAKWAVRGNLYFPYNEDSKAQLNKKYWTKDLVVKKGMSPLDAINDIFEGTYNAQLGCTTAVKTLMMQGVFKHLSKAEDTKAQIEKIAGNDPYVGAEPEKDGQGLLSKYMLRQQNIPWNNWVPGDWGYFKNRDAESAKINGNEGSNSLYIGDGLFAHYYSSYGDHQDVDGMLKYVMGWRLEPQYAEYEDGAHRAAEAWAKIVDLVVTPSVLKEAKKAPEKSPEGMIDHTRDVPRNFKFTVTHDKDFARYLAEAKKQPLPAENIASNTPKEEKKEEAKETTVASNENPEKTEAKNITEEVKKRAYFAVNPVQNGENAELKWHAHKKAEWLAAHPPRRGEDPSINYYNYLAEEIKKKGIDSKELAALKQAHEIESSQVYAKIIDKLEDVDKRLGNMAASLATPTEVRLSQSTQAADRLNALAKYDTTDRELAVNEVLFILGAINDSDPKVRESAMNTSARFHNAGKLAANQSEWFINNLKEKIAKGESTNATAQDKTHAQHALTSYKAISATDADNYYRSVHVEKTYATACWKGIVNAVQYAGENRFVNDLDVLIKCAEKATVKTEADLAAIQHGKAFIDLCNVMHLRRLSKNEAVNSINHFTNFLLALERTGIPETRGVKQQIEPVIAFFQLIIALEEFTPTSKSSPMTFQNYAAYNEILKTRQLAEEQRQKAADEQRRKDAIAAEEERQAQYRAQQAAAERARQQNYSSQARSSNVPNTSSIYSSGNNRLLSQDTKDKLADINRQLSSGSTPTPVRSNYSPTPVRSNYSPTPVRSNYTPTPVRSNYSPTPVRSNSSYGGSSELSRINADIERTNSSLRDRTNALLRANGLSPR